MPARTRTTRSSSPASSAWSQGGQKLVGLLMFDTDVHAVGLKAAQGTYMTTASYWNMDEATRAWSRKFYERTKVMPTMIRPAFTVRCCII